MQTIFPLSQEIISKIAAGEIIERPAYAVKELIENAIDAGADYITIQIDDAGLKRIMITDNGIGMSKEDLLESFKLHTTSKITTDEQLKAINTLGFRGEALASIATMSNMTIRSKRETDTSGTEVIIKNGIPIKISPIGLPVGTTVIVEQLFQPVPVRKKFLKAQSTELRHIIETVTDFGLAFPTIRFFLAHHGRTLIDLPKEQKITDRIKVLLGNDVYEYVIQLSHQDTYISINGYIAKPQIISANNTKQYMFVNKRRVYDRDISLTVKRAYGNLLEPNSYPIFVVDFSLPSEMVDVNIHPRKELVAIINKQLLLSTLEQSIEETLSANNITFENTRWKSDPLYDETLRNIFSPKKGFVNSYTGNLLKDSVIPWSMVTQAEKTDNCIQIHNLYILKQTSNGIELTDQHAAHERILFEQYSEEFLKNKQVSSTYKLSKPIEISLSPGEIQILKEHQKIIKALGFEIQEKNLTSQADSLIIMGIPHIVKDKNVKKYMQELLDELFEKGSVSDIDTQNRKMLAYLACRNAVKAGEQLDENQMRELLDKLNQTNRNATCPHGRPTTVTISLSQLHRLFKR